MRHLTAYVYFPFFSNNNSRSDQVKNKREGMEFIPFVVFNFVVVSAAGYVHRDLPSMSFHSLLDNQTGLDDLVVGLTEVGFLTIHDIPAYEELRLEVLDLATHCAFKKDGHNDIAIAVMADGETVRRTMAGETFGFGSHYSPLTTNEDSDAVDVCTRFETRSRDLRALVSEVSSLFLLKVDKAFQLGLPSVENQRYDSLTEAIANGRHLDHFHVYQRKGRGETGLRKGPSSKIVDMHVDHGLFIIMTPGLVVGGERDKMGHGLEILLPDGNVVQPDLDQDGVLVFMVGKGLLDSFPNHKFRALPHSVRMNGSVRGWFGRMFFPPSDAWIEKEEKSFGAMEEHIRQVHGGYVQDPELSRSLQASSCEIGKETYCWLRCIEYRWDVNPTSCGGPDQVVCVNEITGILWDTVSHCPDCDITCASANANATYVTPTGFCNGILTSMYMTGFTRAGASDEQCIVLFFKSLVLDTPAKFAAGCLAAMAIGIIVELVVKLRREAQFQSSGVHRGNPVHLVLYFLQVMLGYLAMLVAMTYSIALFFMVCIGLVIGHGLFNSSNPNVKEYTDPCCQYDTVAPPSAIKIAGTNQTKETPSL